jgi:hypothetical protein
MIANMTAAALLLVQAVPAQPQSCVAARDVGDMAVVVAPHLIEALAARCGQYAGSAPFVGSDAGRQLASRFRAEAGTASAGAIRAIQGLAGANFPANVPDRLVLAFVGPVVADEIGALSAERCRAADRMIAALAPLPPANVGELVATLITLAPPENRRGLRVCPAQ